jgi:hypothetical protein
MRIRLLGVLLLFSVPAGAVPLAQVQAALWPRANYAPTLMVKGAQSKALAAYGTGPDGTVLDIGALRETGGQAEILTPSGWMLYSEREHRGAANAYNRVGAGWSFGNNSIHSSGRGYFFTVYGVAPTPLQAFDLQYDGAEFKRLQALANAGGTLPPPPSPPVVPPPPPPVVVTPPPAPPPSPPTVVCPAQASVVCPLLNQIAKEFACPK